MGLSNHTSGRIRSGISRGTISIDYGWLYVYDNSWIVQVDPGFVLTTTGGGQIFATNISGTNEFPHRHTASVYSLSISHLGGKELSTNCVLQLGHVKLNISDFIFV